MVVGRFGSGGLFADVGHGDPGPRGRRCPYFLSRSASDWVDRHGDAPQGQVK
jgi:hypothetical protein